MVQGGKRQSDPGIVPELVGSWPFPPGCSPPIPAKGWKDTSFAEEEDLL
jgi:hypothetical protein